MAASTITAQLLEAKDFVARNCVAIAVGLLVVYVVRMRYLHPLSKYPGPFLASLTNFWRLHDYATEKQHVNDLARHKAYGPVYRDGPNSLSFADPRALDAIYGSRAKGEFNKAKWYWTFPFTADDRECNHWMARFVEQARAMKKRVAPLYDMKNALAYEHRMDEHIAKWCEKLAALGTVDIAPWSHYLALDVISDIFYGESMGFIDKGDDIDDHLKAMTDMFHTMSLMVSVPAIVKILKGPIIGSYLQPDPNGKTGIAKCFGHAQRIVEERISKGNVSGKPHFAEYIVQQIGTGDVPMAKDVATGEVIVSIMAGSDSVAAALTPIIYHLARRRDVYDKIKREVADAAKQGSLSDRYPVACYQDTQALPYLVAAIKESMRLEPSFGSTWPREVPAGGWEILPGEHIPGGTDVGVASYVSNRDKSVFGDDAEEFRPERWLTQDAQRRNLMDKFNSIFGYKYSARVCSGQHIAMVEISKTITELFRRFDFELVDPDMRLEGKNHIQIFYEDVLVSFTSLPQRL